MKVEFAAGKKISPPPLSWRICAYTKRYTDYTRIYAHTHTHTHTLTETHAHKETHAHTHTHTQTPSPHADKYANTYKHVQAFTHKHVQAQALTHTHVQALTHNHVQAQALTHKHVQAQALTHTNTHGSSTNLKMFRLFGLKSILSSHILTLGTLDLSMESSRAPISSNSSRASLALSSQYFFCAR